jgi:hypothetical protein
METAGYKSWNETEDAKLLKLDQQGLSRAEIAEKLDRTRSSVATRLSVLRKANRIDAPTNGTGHVTPAASVEAEQPISADDPEVVAMLVISSRLRELPAEARGRVLRWLSERYANEA